MLTESRKTEATRDVSEENYPAVRMIPIGTLRPYPYLEDVFDPLTNSKREQLRKSIAERGLESPITVWRGYILSGKNRTAICSSLGWKEIPAIVRDDLEPAEASLLHMESNLARRESSQAEKARAARYFKDLIEQTKAIQKERPSTFPSYASGYPDGEKGVDLDIYELEGIPREKVEGKSDPDKGDPRKVPSALMKGPIEKGPVGGAMVIHTAEEAAEAMGVSRRQFDDLASAGSAPKEIVDQIGKGVTVKEAASVGRAMKDPTKREAITKKASDFAKADSEQSREEAKGGLLEVAKGKEVVPPQFKQSGPLRASYDANKGKIQIALQASSADKPIPIMLISTQGGFDRAVIEEAFDLAMSFEFEPSSEK